MSPAAAFPAPTEAELRPLSTTLANAVGLPPQAAANIPSSLPSSGSSFYFFDVAQPTLPGGVPAAQSAPGTAMAPAPPAVPPVEAASLPAAPVVPPATALSAPPEAELRPLPTTLAGAAGLPAQAVVNTPASLPYGSSFYFFDAAQPAASPSVPAFDPEPYEFHSGMMPDLGFTRMQFDPRMIRRDFPILQEQVHGRPLIWLDSAATTQKPNAVIDRLAYFYRHENSNVHRASHTLAARSTDAYEGAREKVRRFLNASSPHEIVFVRGTTEGINLVAQSWGRRYVEKDDEVVITWLEHHANIVPWQMLCAEKGARLRVAPVDDRGQVRLEEYEKLLGPRTRLVAFSQVSNALGTILPAREMVEMAHRYGAHVLVDGAQAVAHMRVDVQALDCDFYVFSGHKVFAPTGIGVVFGKAEILETAPPWQGGGHMIADVTFEKTQYQPPPMRFEAGTASIADAVGLGAALDYLSQIGIENVTHYEHGLLTYATERLLGVPGLHIIGTAREKAGVISFVLDGFRTEDVGKALDMEGIALRSGHHCAQPILRRFGVESTVRPSLALYNTCEDIDALVAALLRIQAGRGHRGL
jgi:cysteine desulfurase/selenocysteine lyase